MWIFLPLVCQAIGLEDIVIYVVLSSEYLHLISMNGLGY